MIVVDGCATQCASKLATAAGAKPTQRIVVSQDCQGIGSLCRTEIRLSPDGLKLARRDRGGDARQIRLPLCGGGRIDRRGGFGASPDFVVMIHDKYEFRIPLTGLLSSTPTTSGCKWPATGHG